MIKTTIAAVWAAICILFSGVTVMAKECPLPEPNTEADIKFAGFDWYCDYSKAMESAKERGMESFLDSFEPDLSTTAHWTFIQDPSSYYSDCEDGCGGYIRCGRMPQVAGYNIDHTMLCFMLNNADGYGLDDYEKEGAIKFYMGIYNFNVSDQDYCYNDLVEKLKGIYGNSPNSGGDLGRYKYMYWLNRDGAMVGLVDGGVYGVSLMYMAPGAEDQLCEVERIATENEKLNAVGDVSGL